MAPSRGLSRIITNIRCNSPARNTRTFTQTSGLLSGHNRWSKIKHDKGKADAAKNRSRSVFAREIAGASKLFGPDPATNPRLADIITKAKREGFAKASIEAAIARGQGRSATGESLENVTIEGILPGGVGVVIECETDSKARTMMELRQVLKEAGGVASPSAFLFEKKGRVVFEGLTGSEDGLEKVLDAALDAGAEDVEEGEDGEVTVLCEPNVTIAVGEAVANGAGLELKLSEIVWVPIKDTMVELSNDAASDELNAFVDAVQDKAPGVTVALNVA